MTDLRPAQPPSAAALRRLYEEPVQRERLVPPADEDFWVFGYGSLMWNPGFPHLEVRQALLYGYHRRFCVYSHRYRGTPERPGLVLGLDRGGCCHGMVFRVPAAETAAVMDYLWDREMTTGVYIPRWLDCRTPEGTAKAAGFVVDQAHPQYTGKLPMAQIADLIVQGYGQKGPCSDYLQNTIDHLHALGIHDRRLARLLREVRRRCGP
ncbi:gamma-glutamylcyclotransferase [Algihabitans albus]|uniref:gamma-glutamylcyclotransferase n=1 Tax=Algihabitans albus TaxID=2164067 RepID=UPI0035D04DC1